MARITAGLLLFLALGFGAHAWVTADVPASTGVLISTDFGHWKEIK